MPARVSNSRCRQPLRPLIPVLPHRAVGGTTHGLGPSRHQRVHEDPRNPRSKSRLARANCSSTRRTRSTLDGTAIIVSLYESVVRDHSKDHAPTAIAPTRHAHREPYTTLPDATLTIELCAMNKIAERWPGTLRIRIPYVIDIQYHRARIARAFLLIIEEQSRRELLPYFRPQWQQPSNMAAHYAVCNINKDSW